MISEMMAQTLSIVIPAYNEEDGIAHFIDSVTSVPFNFSSIEILVIDDGSKDRTSEIVSEIASNNPSIKLIRLARNSGHMAALTAGFEICTGDWVVTIDADGQDDPALIPAMYQECLMSNSDICYMQRSDRRQDPLRHRIFSPLFYRLVSSFTKGQSPYQAADFRLVSKRVVDVLKTLPEVNKVYRILIPALGFKSSTLYYYRRARTKGKSKYGFGALASLGLRSVLATSGAPLRWVSLFSIGGALLGTFISVIALLKGIFANTIPGWSSLAVLISILFTFQAITSFVICEFLLVLLGDTRRRPLFQIEQSGKES